MRRPTTALLVLGVVPALVIALPTITKPVPTAHPVAPDMTSVRLAGVDTDVLPGFRAAVRAQRPDPGAGGTAAVEGEHSEVGDGRTVVLTAPRSTDDFQAVGVTWKPAPASTALAVDVRTHSDRGWSGWHAMVVEPGEGPDASSPDVRGNPDYRDGTSPYFVGPADGVQVRVGVVSGSVPDGLRVDLVDPGASAADAHLTPALPASSASAATSRPTIISRKAWGADEGLRNGFAGYTSTIRAGFIHHTDSSNAYTEAQAAALVRSVYAYHTDGRGYSDIAYNFLVDKYGRIFEGRGGGVAKSVLGAHTGGFNTSTFGVAALGNLDAAKPTSAMLTAYERLFAWKLSLYGRNPLGRVTLTSSGGGTARYGAGVRHAFDVISGHRDAGYTACPGQYLYPKLPAIRKAVANLMASPSPSPSPSPPSPSPSPTPTPTPASATSGTTFVPLAPATVASTLTGAGTGHGKRALSGSYDRVVLGLAGHAGVPGKATSVSLTVRARNSGGGGVMAYPTNHAHASRVFSFAPGRWRTGHTTALLDSRGRATVRVVGVGRRSTQLVVAVDGYFVPGTSGMQFHPMTPARIVNTGASGGGGPIGPGRARFVDVDKISGVPGTARAVAVDVIGFGATRATEVTLVPSEGSTPATPTLSVLPHENTRRVAVVGLSAYANLDVHNRSGRVNVALDVLGWYGPAAAGPGSDYVALSARHVASTRTGTGVAKAPMRPGHPLTFRVTGRAGVPRSGVSRVALQVTAYTPSARGYLTAYSADGGSGLASLSVLRGRTETNLVVVPVSANGSVRIRSQSVSAQVDADVVGYFQGRG